MQKSLIIVNKAMMLIIHCILLGCTLLVYSEASLTPQQEKELLDTHNLKRQQVDPPASYMPNMVWNSILADSAQKISARCQLEDSVSQPRSSVHRYGRQGVGKNVFVLRNIQNLDIAMNAWFSNGRYYNYRTRSCYPGRDCSSYTQLVWATSTDLGCGITDCPTIDGGYRVTSGKLLVCLYGPAGNLPGRPPYPTTRSSQVDALLHMVLVQGANEKELEADAEEFGKAMEDEQQPFMWQ